ncbi:MAG TPA: alkaline phosphatase family protein [Vicinamibacterales bacterium]|nr:alkaline phosphatase family protein [Vicinamibacterales bacterium]
MRHARPVVAALAIVFSIAFSSAACGGARYLTAPEGAPPAPAWSASRLTPHVMLISIDGLRPDAIGAVAAPTFQRLIREGSYTLKATTISPSKTLPSHTSMLTGQPPERHRVLWNTPATADKDLVELPTVFGVARSRGYRTAAFFSKSKFQPLQQPGSLDYSQAPGGWFGRWKSTRTVSDVEKHLLTARPNLMFVHLSEPDRAGHSSGWMSLPYRRAVVAADAAVGRLIAAAERAYGAGNYTVIITADHGGHGYDHGSDDPRDVTIPWIAWGRGVAGGEIGAAVRTMDTASTVLWLLGVDQPADWRGQPVLTAFQR